MLILDMTLAAGGILGFFLSILYFIGYFRRKEKRAFFLGSISFSLAFISILPLLYFVFGSLEGEIPVWGWIFPIPVTVFILITIIKLILNTSHREGGVD